MSFTSSPAVADRVDAVFRDAGLDGWLHVLDVDSGAEFGLRGDSVCESASTGKVPILVALMQAVAAGKLTLDEQIDVPAGERTDGPTGLSKMAYPARLALGDIAQLMIAISDNHATDLVLRRVPPGQVTAAMRDLGLPVTTIELTISEMFANFKTAAADGKVPGDLGKHPEAAGWRTTPAEMCRLLQAIWRDEAAPAELCEQIRRMLRSCLTSNGLVCELPLIVQATSGHKTGTLVAVEDEDGTGAVLRSEVGVVEFPDGHRYAVAVFTRFEGSGIKLRDVAAERVVGTAVRTAIDGLRADADGQGLPGNGFADR